MLFRSCYEIARDYALSRRQFGRPIAEFQMVQSRLARMYVALSNCRRIVYADYLAGRRQLLRQPVVVTEHAAVFVTETDNDCARQRRQIDHEAGLEARLGVPQHIGQNEPAETVGDIMLPP